MTELSGFLHYGTIASCIAITALGVGIGEGFTSQAAIDALEIQPNAKSDIAKVNILGAALVETAAIISSTMALIMLFSGQTINEYTGYASLGIAFAICLSGFFVGLLSAKPAQAAVLAVARQPFFSQQIGRFMLVCQSIIQSPIIFAFIISMFIRSQSADLASFPDALRLLSAGLCIGLGSIGPVIGLAHFAQYACNGLGYNRHAYNKLLTFTFISQAIIETPIILSLVISIFICFSFVGDNMIAGVAFLASALCMGLGTFGPGISSGKTAAQACKQIAINPDIYGTVSKVSIFGQGVIDTAAIYAFLVSLGILILK